MGVNGPLFWALVPQGFERHRLLKALGAMGEVKVFEATEEFLKAAQSSPGPALGLVDVRLTSWGGQFLGKAPLIQEQKGPPLCFLYSQRTAPLVPSTDHIPGHLGLVNMDLPLEGQVRTILTRRPTPPPMAQQDHHAHKKLLAKLQHYERQEFYRKLVEKIDESIKDIWTAVDFYDALVERLGKVNFIHRQGLYLSSRNGQELISPLYEHRGHEQLPSIWGPGPRKDMGLGPLEQNQAAQTVLNLWGGNYAQIYLYGDAPDPLALLFVESEEEMIDHFPWLDLEKRLNIQFSRHLVARGLERPKISQQLNAFEFFEFIEKKRANFTQGHYTLKAIDFSRMVHLAQASSGLQVFSWQQFCTEFFHSLLSRLEFDCKYCPYSASFVFFVMREEHSDDYDKVAKRYCGKFPFWRYFDSPDKMIVSDVSPKIQSLPLSVSAVRRYASKSKEVGHHGPQGTASH